MDLQKILILIGLISVLGLIFLGSMNSHQTRSAAESLQGTVLYRCDSEIAKAICKYQIDDSTESVVVAENERVIRQPIINSLGEVLYLCPISDGIENQFCLAKGSEIQLIETNIPSDRYGFSFNTHGQIAYQCRTADADWMVNSICALEIASGESYQLNPKGYSAVSPIINERGEVLFGCNLEEYANHFVRDLPEGFAPFKLCKMNFNGTDFAMLTPDDMWLLGYDVNNYGDIVFSCVKHDQIESFSRFDDSLDICAVNEPHGDLMVVESPGVILGDISLNDAGEFAYICSLTKNQFKQNAGTTICYGKIGDDEIRSSDDLINQVGGFVALNNQGVVTFVCYNSDQRGPYANEVCISKLDGSQFKRITFDSINNGYPAIK